MATETELKMSILPTNVKVMIRAAIHKETSLVYLRNSWHETNPNYNNQNRNWQNQNDIAEWAPRLSKTDGTVLAGKECASFRVLIWYSNATRKRGIKRIWLTTDHYTSYEYIKTDDLEDRFFWEYKVTYKSYRRKFNPRLPLEEESEGEGEE